MHLSSAVLAATGSLQAARVLPLQGLMVVGFGRHGLLLRHAISGRHAGVSGAGALTIGVTAA